MMIEKKTPLIIAHRGGALVAPENTLYAFRHALNLGYTIMECDVQLTKDLVPVVIHDNNVRRTTNGRMRRSISNITLKELKKLDAASWFSKEIKNETIPTLQELLNLLYGQATLMLDIKEDPSQGEKLGDAIAEVLEGMRYTPKEKKSVLLGSYHAESYLYLREILPEYPAIAIIKDDHEYDMYRDIDVSLYGLMFLYATKGRIERLHERGKQIWVWTVDEELEAKILYDYGVDGIITNHPEKIKKALAPSLISH